LPRKRDIEAAVAAHNATDGPKQLPLPPEAARLLTVMFPRHSVCECSLGDLVAKGFDERTARLLLRALGDAGFLSKEVNRRGLIATYHLHLPPLVRR
jgi:hypothetical protein